MADIANVAPPPHPLSNLCLVHKTPFKSSVANMFVRGELVVGHGLGVTVTKDLV